MTWRNIHDICTKKNEVINKKCIYACLYKCIYVNLCLEKRRESSCYVLNACVPTKIHISKPNSFPDMMVKGLWAVIRIRWGHEDRALSSGISAHITVIREPASPLCPLPCAGAKRSRQPAIQKNSPESNRPDTLILEFHLPER